TSAALSALWLRTRLFQMILTNREDHYFRLDAGWSVDVLPRPDSRWLSQVLRGPRRIIPCRGGGGTARRGCWPQPGFGGCPQATNFALTGRYQPRHWRKHIIQTDESRIVRLTSSSSSSE